MSLLLHLLLLLLTSAVALQTATITLQQNA
jgi:hypothetical protein